ncbi:MAG TPA: hypothetical protein VGE26_07395 [Sphingobacteriaceae bacterium]
MKRVLCLIVSVLGFRALNAQDNYAVIGLTNSEHEIIRKEANMFLRCVEILSKSVQVVQLRKRCSIRWFARSPGTGSRIGLY